VVGNRDDVPGAAFQSTIEISADRENVYIEVTVACSSETVNSLISDGAAVIVLHVDCSNTLYRRAFPLSEFSQRIAISAENLNDTVETTVFVSAAKDIGSYRVANMHPDYGDATFVVTEGDILAIGESYIFEINAGFDSMQRLGSIMQIDEAKEEGDIPLRVDFNGDKILIFLSKSDFKDYKLLKNDEFLSGPLTCTIVLPVLLEAIYVWKSEAEDESISLRRWQRVLRHKVETLGLGNESDNLILAQRLLELPIKRALVSSRQRED